MPTARTTTYFQDVCKATAEALRQMGGTWTASQIAELYETPNRKGLGDSALPCFPLARELKVPPPKIAARLAEMFQRPEAVVRVEPISGYFNIWYDAGILAQSIMPAIVAQGGEYGSSTEGADKTVCMDYSHPNIAKPFGVGHLRSTVIGHSLKRILEKLGYRTVGINHLGDWGTQFGKLIVAFHDWGNEDTLQREPIRHLYDLYVRFHTEAAQHPELQSRARQEFKKLEDGDAGNRRLWQRFRELSLTEFERVYRRLGVAFDSDAGEAFYEDRLPELIARLQQLGIARTGEDGALVIPVGDQDEPPLLLRKADGATLYATRDLAAAEYRHTTYAFDQCLYIVGTAQTLHFKQLFAALRRIGYAWADRMVHVDFGWVKFADTMMSTRRGNIVLLDDVLAEAVDLTRRIIAERNPDLENPDAVAEAVGVGAVVFWMLSVKRQKDVNFDWEDVLSFDGRTGPYLQYTHARLCSLLSKWGTTVPQPSGTDLTQLQTDEERQLLLLLADWPRRIHQAARQYEPQIIAASLLDMAQAYNKFYQNIRILDGDPHAAPARIILADCLRQVIASGLFLMGLDAPRRM